jgi:hypothetical protein
VLAGIKDKYDLEIQSLVGGVFCLLVLGLIVGPNLPEILRLFGFNRVDHFVDSIGQDQFPQWDDGIGDT